MTVMGMLMSVSFMTVSRSQPLERLSSVRPLASVFHPSLFLSIMGQFALHLFCMLYVVSMAKAHLGAEWTPDLEGVFKPNLINSVVFLVSASQQVSVFAVNLKGPPFMTGMMNNTPLLYSLAISFLGAFFCASETVPQLNKWLQIEPFPDPVFRNIVLGVLAADLGVAFVWDRVLQLIFAPEILRASFAGIKPADVFKALKVLAIVCVGIYWLATGDYTELEAEWAKQLDEQEGGAAAAPLVDDSLLDRIPAADPEFDNYFEQTVGGAARAAGEF